MAEIPSVRVQEIRVFDLLCPVAGCTWRMPYSGPGEVPARGDHPPDYVRHYLAAHLEGGGPSR